MGEALTRHKIVRRGLIATGLVIAVAALVFFAGPRVDTTYHPGKIELPADLDGYLARTEAAVPGLIAGAEKKIVWAHADKRRTSLAVVYLHGFTATRQETAPLAERVAAALGANLYCTRLSGHGIDAEALAGAKTGDWLRDAQEALAIGERIGDKVLVVGCSMGGALAAWLAAAGPRDHLKACVLISPNLWPSNKNARMALWPWARQLLPRIHDPLIVSPPHNELHARYWITRYPLVALLPMMGLCQLAREQDYAGVATPLLMIYCPEDKVIDLAVAKAVFAQWGSSAKKLVAFTPPAETERHVIAGDIRAPGGTQPLTDEIVGFVRSLP